MGSQEKMSKIIEKPVRKKIKVSALKSRFLHAA